MQKSRMKTPRYPTATTRRVLWLAMLMIAGFGLPALAVKPGSKGPRSTASATISLEVYPSVQAHLVNRSTGESELSPGESDNYLCLDVWDTRTLSFFILTEGTDGSTIAPIANWSFADPSINQHSDTLRCPISVPLNLSGVEPAATGHVTLIVSPE